MSVPEVFHERLIEYAAASGVKLRGEPEDHSTGEGFQFLIWGNNPCVFFNERDGEVGHGARRWVEAYAATGRKPSSPQHDDAQVFFEEQHRDGSIVNREWA